MDETRIYDTLYYYNGYMKNHIVHESRIGDTLIYKIPSQPRGTNIAYYISLNDSFGNKTRLPEVDYEQFWVLSPVPPSDCETDTLDQNIEISWALPGEGLVYHSGYPYQSKIDTFALRFTTQYFPAHLRNVSVYAEKTIPDTGIIYIDFYSVDDGLPGVEIYPSQEIKITEDEANWVELQLDSLSVTDEIFIVFYTDGVQLFGDGNKDVYRTFIKDNLWTTDTTFGNLLAQAECFYEPESIFYRVMKEDSLQFVVIADSLTNKEFMDTTVYGETRYRYLVQTHYIIPNLNGTSQILSQVYDYTPPVFGDSVAVYESDSGYFVSCEITDGIGIAMDSLIYNDTGTGKDSIVNNWYWYTIPKDIKDLRRASSATPNWNSETRFAHIDMKHPHSFVFTQDRLGSIPSRERKNEEGIYSQGIASPVCVRTRLRADSLRQARTGRHKLSIEDELAMTQQHKGYPYNANEDQDLLFQISPSPGSSPVKGEEIERRMAISPADEGKSQLALVYDNIFQSNDTGMVFSDCAIGMVRKNEITSNNIGVYITDNALPILGIRMSGKNSFIVESDTLDTLQNYAVYNNTPFYILAQGNWWGTNDEDSISAIIWDYYDDENLGIVDFTPFRKTSEIFGGDGNGGAQTVSEESVIEKFKFSIPSLVNGSNIKVSSYIPKRAKITIDIYDIAGRLKRRIKRIENKGNRSFFIDCGHLGDGIYFIRFKVEGYCKTKKTIVLH